MEALVYASRADGGKRMKILTRLEGDTPFPAMLAGQDNWEAPRTDSEQSRETRRKELWDTLREAQGPEEFQAFLAVLQYFDDRKRRPIAREDLCVLRLECLSRLLSTHEADSDVVRGWVERYLLPLCLRPRRDIPLRVRQAMRRDGNRKASRKGPLTDVGDYWSWREAHEAREQLESWVQDLPPVEREAAREPLTDKVLLAIDLALADFEELKQNTRLTAPFHVAPFAPDDTETAPLTHQFRRGQAALLTLSSLGFRSHATEEVLATLIERDDSIGSAALNCFAALGVPDRHAQRVQVVLRRQARNRPQAHIGFAFQELADETQFDSAQLLMERSVHQAMERALSDQEKTPRSRIDASSEAKNRLSQLRDWEIAGNASLVNIFLSRHPFPPHWHDRMWNVLWTLHGTISALMGESHATFLGSGSKFTGCNSLWMPRDILLTLIPSFGEDPGNEHFAGSHFLRSLALEGIEKCVEPRSLAGLVEMIPHANAFPAVSLETNLDSQQDMTDVLNSLLPWLRKDALRDTHYNDSNDNSLRSLKRRAWRLILLLGLMPPRGWLKEAFENEKSGHVRGAICDIAAHLRLNDIPESFFELTRQHYDAVREPPYDEFLSRMGVQQVLANSASRAAFEALLHAGFTMGGDLMMATIRHLGECAFGLHREGDREIVARLLAHATEASVPRQREAAVGALRLLCLRKCVSAEYLPGLLRLAHDTALPAYARAMLVEAIGSVELDPYQRDLVESNLMRIFERFSPAEFPARRVRGEHELGWAAAETLVKLDLWHDLGTELTGRLPFQGIQADTKSRDGGTGSHAAVVLGHLWKQNEEQWAGVVSSILRRGSLRDVAPLVKAINDQCQSRSRADFNEEAVSASRALLAEALANRILEGQSRSKSEISLFEPLALLSPKRLVTFNWEACWKDWLPDARLALAEAIGHIPFSDNDGEHRTLRHRSVEILRALAGDGLFAVRRAAYRSLRSQGNATLWSLCLEWASASDFQLRQRAAEATAWMTEDFGQPVDRFYGLNLSPQVELLSRALTNDPEKDVREAAKRSEIERKKRLLSDAYLEIVERCFLTATNSGPRDTNWLLLQCYRYGRALIHVGQDDHLKRLQKLARQDDVPAHLRHWINEVIEPLEANWKQVTQKWPQPWLPWEGNIEELDGFVIRGDERLRAHFSLWSRPATTLQDFSNWGGAILPREQSQDRRLTEMGESSAKNLGLLMLGANELEIQIPGRNRTKVHVLSTGTNRATLISSNEPYPDVER